MSTQILCTRWHRLSLHPRSGVLAAFALSTALAAGSSVNFTTDGLNYETELLAIYLGDFAHARLARLSPEFTTLFSRYIEAFSNKCSAFLPADRVAITRKQCAVESYRANRYGTQVGPSSCNTYVDVPTGYYAAPDVARAKVDLEEQYSREVMGRMLSGGIPQALTGATDAENGLGGDLDALLGTNRCDSEGTRRFQNNLLRFAKAEEPLRLPGASTIESLRPKRSMRVGTTDAIIGRLVTELVADNARGWTANRYVAGSVDEVSVTARDPQGGPSRAQGYYLYESGNGRKVGTVRVDFQNALPSCLYFGDAPTACRAASRRVITAFEKGIYENAPR